MTNGIMNISAPAANRRIVTDLYSIMYLKYLAMEILLRPMASSMAREKLEMCKRAKRKIGVSAKVSGGP